MKVPCATDSFTMSHGWKYSRPSSFSIADGEPISITGLSSPVASFDAANSIRHHPRVRHVLKSQQRRPGRSAAPAAEHPHLRARRDERGDRVDRRQLRRHLARAEPVVGAPLLERRVAVPCRGPRVARRRLRIVGSQLFGCSPSAAGCGIERSIQKVAAAAELLRPPRRSYIPGSRDGSRIMWLLTPSSPAAATTVPAEQPRAAGSG